jgi:hypothetical protein
MIFEFMRCSYLRTSRLRPSRVSLSDGAVYITGYRAQASSEGKWLPPRRFLLFATPIRTSYEQMLINGKRIDAASGQPFATRNPAIRELQATVAEDMSEESTGGDGPQGFRGAWTSKPYDMSASHRLGGRVQTDCANTTIGCSYEGRRTT